MNGPKVKILFLTVVLTTTFIYPDNLSAKFKKHKGSYSHGPVIGRTIPNMQLNAFHKGEIKKIALKEYRGKWMVLFFYPGDFTFVCPTELKELSKYYDRFQKKGAEILSISTDSVYVHRAWAKENPDIGKIRYPMLSDRPGDLSRVLNVYMKDKGYSIRASFIIDPDGRIVACEMHEESIGRSAEELLRKLKAAKAVRESEGGFCPAGWHEGDKLIKPK